MHILLSNKMTILYQLNVLMYLNVSQLNVLISINLIMPTKQK